MRILVIVVYMCLPIAAFLASHYYHNWQACKERKQPIKVDITALEVVKSCNENGRFILNDVMFDCRKIGKVSYLER